MTISRFKRVLLPFVLCFPTLAMAQIDSVQDVETMSDPYEDLVEQTPDADESSVMDYLQPGEREGGEHLTLRSRFRSSLDCASGYSNGYYVGSPVQSYQRVGLYANDHISGALLMKKDPGERNLNDFSSGSLALRNFGPFSKLILGDYFVEGGEGVMLWRNVEAGKGSNVVAPAMRTGRGLMPYQCGSESGFFRGIGGQISFGRSSLILMASRTPENASLDSLGRVSGMYSNSYFRTVAELQKKHDLTEQLLGGRIQWALSDNVVLGSTYYSTQFSRTYLVDHGDVFGGTSLSMASIDYQMKSGISSYFGEWSTSNRAMGGISGIALTPSQSLTFVASFRSYPRSFISPHGRGFGERSSDETGAYMGLSVRLHEHLRFSSYIDCYSFSSVPFSLFGSVGRDMLIQSEFIPHRRIQLSLGYQLKRTSEDKSVLTAAGLTDRIPSVRDAQHLKMDIAVRVSPMLLVRSRFEEVILNDSPSGEQQKGWLTYHDLKARVAGGMSANLRMIFFETESYDARVYELERDLTGVCSMPGLYGRGMKWYILILWPLTDFMQVGLKYSELLRDDVKRIGTGEDQLPANRDRRIGLQFDASF